MLQTQFFFLRLQPCNPESDESAGASSSTSSSHWLRRRGLYDSEREPRFLFLPRCCDASDSLPQIWHRRRQPPAVTAVIPAVVAPSSVLPQTVGGEKSAGSCSPRLEEEGFIEKEQEQQLERRWRGGGGEMKWRGWMEERGGKKKADKEQEMLRF